MLTLCFDTDRKTLEISPKTVTKIAEQGLAKLKPELQGKIAAAKCFEHRW